MRHGANNEHLSYWASVPKGEKNTRTSDRAGYTEHKTTLLVRSARLSCFETAGHLARHHRRHHHHHQANKIG